MFVSILQLMTLPFGKPVQSRPGPEPLSGTSQKTSKNDNRGISRRKEDRVLPEQRLPAGVLAESAQSGASRRQEVKSPATKPAAKTKASVSASSRQKESKPASKAPASAPAKELKGGKRKAEPVARPASTKLPAKVTKVKATTVPVAKAPVKASAKSTIAPVKVVQKAKLTERTKTAKAGHSAIASSVGKSAVTAQSPKKAASLASKATPAAAQAAPVEPVVKSSPVAAVSTPKPVVALPTPAPAKAGRPSRLSQITVPSMAQSVASTAAKASYSNTMSAPVLTPPTYIPAKKDLKLANNWKLKAADELTDAEVLAMPDDEYMNDKQLAFFRSKLLLLKQGILSNAGETTEHLRADTVIVPDPADRATIEEEHALELRTRDRERKLLKKIEQSIARIDAGDYGYCDETGEPIGVGRLLARPTATLSLEAQQRRELKQKMFGD